MSVKTDPVGSQIRDWVSHRPTPSEIEQAITELQDLIVFAKMHGMYAGEENLGNVIRWLWIAGQLPLEWLENELNGIKG